MINHQNQHPIQLTWQAMLWRLILTVLLLVVLAGSSLTVFHNITSRPNAQVLPTLTYEIESGR